MAQGQRMRNYPSPNSVLTQVAYPAGYGSVTGNDLPNTSMPQVTAPTAIMHARSELRQQGPGVIDLTFDSDWDRLNIPNEAVPDSRFRAYDGLRIGPAASGMQTLGRELFPDLTLEQTLPTSNLLAPDLAPVNPPQYGYPVAFENASRETRATQKRRRADGNESQPTIGAPMKRQKGAHDGLGTSGVGEYLSLSSENGGFSLEGPVVANEACPAEEVPPMASTPKRGRKQASSDRILDWPTGLRWLIPGRTMKDGKPKCHENLATGGECNRRTYPGSNRCDRHTGSWLFSQPGFPMLQYDHSVNFEEARRSLYPQRNPLPAAQFDASLERETAREDVWVREFVAAADSPPHVDAGTDQDTRDHIQAQGHNFTGTVALKRFTNPKGSYSLKMINVRMRLLFHVALWVHRGGEAIIPLSGDNEGYGPTEIDYTFLQRLQILRGLLRDYKLIAMDVIEGRSLVAVAECPEKVRKRKVQNQTSNKNKEKMIDAERRRQQALLRGDVPEDAAPHPPRKGKGKAPKAPKAQGTGTQPKKALRQVKAPVVELQAPVVELQAPVVEREAPAIESQCPEEAYNTATPQYLYLNHGAAEPTRYEHVGLYMPQAGSSTQSSNLQTPCNNTEVDRAWFNAFGQQLQAYDDTSRAEVATDPSNANGMGADWFTDYDAFIQAGADEVAGWQQSAGEAGNGELPYLDMFGAQPLNNDTCDGNDFDVYGLNGTGFTGDEIDGNRLNGSDLDQYGLDRSALGSAQLFDYECSKGEPHRDDNDGRVVKKEPLDKEESIELGAFDQERIDAVIAEVSSPPNWEDALEYPEVKVARATATM